MNAVASSRAGSVQRILVFCLFLALSLSLEACGKKAPPKPPQEIAPAMVEVFTAEGLVKGISLSWNAPRNTANGAELLDLAGFIVWRREVFKDRKEKEGDFEQIADIPITDKVPSENKSATTERYAYVDSDVYAGRKYDYYVAAYNQSGDEGSPSSYLRITFIGESSVVIGSLSRKR